MEGEQPNAWIDELAYLHRIASGDASRWSPPPTGDNDGRVWGSGQVLADCEGHEGRASFIAAAYNRLPALIELARRMARAMAAGHFVACPMCSTTSHLHHEDGCEWSAVLEAAREAGLLEEDKR